ncbi:MAG: ATP-binding protein [Minicystis sp.]
MGERYVLVRAAALSVEFFGLVEELYGPDREDEADQFARNILFDLAHAVGKSDAQSFCARMGLVEPLERLSAGPIHFAYTGWAKVDIHPESRPVPGDDFYLLYDHPYSFESDAWIRAGHRRQSPVCIMNAGYSSGWTEHAFGTRLVSAEVLCRARGDDACRFIMAPTSRIEAYVALFRKRRGLAVGRPPGRTTIPDFFSRKRTEDELRRAQGELERRVEERTRELRHANEQLKREIEERERAESRLLQTYKLEAIGRLAGGIAHDFNNLMAIITVNSDLLRRHIPEGDPALGFLDDISAAGVRATALTQQLLAFSRAQPTRAAVLDLNAIVTDLGRMLARVIGEDVVLVTRLEGKLGAVEADRGQIEQVLMNLVVNARDAMPGGGTLTIETGNEDVDEARADKLGGLEPGPYVALTVRDTGTGMDEETLAHIFDPFFTTKGMGKGTGLGLATVYGIVKQAGGGIAVRSTPGKGTTFSIYLARSEGVVPSNRKEAPRSDAPEGTETVLVVEDQERLREVLGVVLRGFGYEVIAARDAEDALRLATSHDGPIDLLLTDVVMPKTSGPMLAERIRAVRPGIGVLFMSGYTADAMEQHGGTKQGAALLQKPFRPDELGRAIRAALAARAEG